MRAPERPAADKRLGLFFFLVPALEQRILLWIQLIVKKKNSLKTKMLSSPHHKASSEWLQMCQGALRYLRKSMWQILILTLSSAVLLAAFFSLSSLPVKVIAAACSFSLCSAQITSSCTRLLTPLQPKQRLSSLNTLPPETNYCAIFLPQNF